MDHRPDAVPGTRPPEVPGPAPRWWWTLVAGVVLVVVVAVVARAVDHVLEAEPHAEPAGWAAFVDLDTEANLPTFVATVLLLVLAGATALRAAVADRRSAPAWWVLASLAALLALDEATSMHERFLDPLGERIGGGEGALGFAWVVPGAVLVVGAAAVLARVTRRLPAGVRGRLAVAAGTYLLGALGAEVVGATVLDQQGRGVAYHAAVVVEESLELAGVLLALRAVLPGLAVERRAGRLEVAEAARGEWS